MNEAVRLEPVTVSFLLLNLAFRGEREPTIELGTADVDVSRLSFRVGPRTLTLVQLPAYESARSQLRRTGRPQATCVLRTALTAGAELVTLYPIVERICLLLTLAAGSQITWLSCATHTASGEVVRERRRSSVARNFSGWTLIDTGYPQQLRSFVEATYPVFERLEADYQLARVIDARADAIAGGSFLETRTLIAGALLDYLSRRYALLARYQRRSFRERLGYMAKDHQTGFKGSEVQTVIDIRDTLAHEMTFRAGEAVVSRFA